MVDVDVTPRHVAGLAFNELVRLFKQVNVRPSLLGAVAVTPDANPPPQPPLMPPPQPPPMAPPLPSTALTLDLESRLRAAETALIVVHPWGIDDGQGWDTPQPAGVADFCTPEKNHLAAEHTRGVIDPFLKSLRGKVALVMYSLPGDEDAIRKKLYRSFTARPMRSAPECGAPTTNTGWCTLRALTMRM